jgi:hypothetical protein
MQVVAIGGDGEEVNEVLRLLVAMEDKLDIMMLV